MHYMQQYAISSYNPRVPTADQFMRDNYERQCGPVQNDDAAVIECLLQDDPNSNQTSTPSTPANNMTQVLIASDY